MRYSEIIVYRRDCDGVTAHRVTKAYDCCSYKELSIADMYRGHCAWVAEQINNRMERKAA